MAQELRITTTGTLNPVPIDDLGISFPHPTTDVNVIDNLTFSGYGLTDYYDSLDFQAALNDGYITATNESGVTVSSLNVLALAAEVTETANADTYVTGGTYVSSAETLTLARNDDADVDISLTALTQQTVNYFNGYDNAGGTLATSTGVWVDVPLDSQRQLGSNYTHSTITDNEEVTINESGTYLVIGNVSTEGTSGSRTQAQCRLAADTGGGYQQVDGTVCEMYLRNDNYGASGGFSAVLDLNVRNKVKLQFQRSGPGTTGVELQPNGSSLTIVNIKGPKGDKGDTGSTTGLTHDRQSISVTASTSTVSPTLVDLADMTLTTKDLGGPATYTIYFDCTRSNTTNVSLNNFNILVDGSVVRTKVARTLDFFTPNELWDFTMNAVVTGVTSGSIIKIQYDSNGGGTHTINDRNLMIDGILDANVVE